jgi:hypothetical protein
LSAIQLSVHGKFFFLNHSWFPLKRCRARRPFANRFGGKQALYLILISVLVVLAACRTPRVRPAQKAAEPPRPVVAASHSPKKPDWVEQESAKYPNANYLTGVGAGKSRKIAADDAFATVARVFKAEVSSKSQDWERYSQTQAGGAVQVDHRLQVEQFTAVSTQKVIEDLAIAETWTDPADKTVYALAVMSRKQVGALLESRIQALDRDISHLTQTAQSADDKIEKIRALRKARNALIQRNIYETDLRIVNPAGANPASPSNLVDIQQELQQLLTRKMRIGVEFSGAHGEAIRSAVLEGLTRDGFAVQPSRGGEVDLMIKGDVTFERADLPQWKSIRWIFAVNLVNQATEKVIGTLNQNGREAHINFTEAEAKAVRALQDQILQNLSSEMVAFILGTRD